MEQEPIKSTNAYGDTTLPEKSVNVIGDFDELHKVENVSQETNEIDERDGNQHETSLEEVQKSTEAIVNENQKLIELATSSNGPVRNRSKASIVGTMLFAAGMGMGLGHSEEANAHDQGNIIKAFGDQITRGVSQQIIEAGRDSGGVMGGAARVMIDRTINSATHRVLETAGVPTVRAPEQVVVVPRSVEGGPGVYTQQGHPGYGQVQYGGGAVVRGGYAGGYENPMVNRMRDIDARYALEKSRLSIELNSNPEQIQATKERHELDLMRLNKSFKDRVNKVQPDDERMIAMKEWSAAKAQLIASQRMQSPEGRFAEIEKRHALDAAAVQNQYRR